LEYRDRNTGRLCGDRHGLARRIAEYPLAQALWNIDQPLESAGELADSAMQCCDIEPLIAAPAILGSGLNVATASARDQRQQPAPFRRRCLEECLSEFGRYGRELLYCGRHVGCRRRRCALPIRRV